ncbi:hypothetical protein [Comamonas aquatica]|uniref:hypothetical protein n=1 Tax=Comamonas aquatica TaxID=225991 RepID=UPI001E5A5862|nr:hypothetical protein [Comamonas aquatica]MDH0372453.1 hypothetical protein [Comamonas aquatica]MDH0492994.1 hypothetical protein [Comamonas aquatica]
MEAAAWVEVAADFFTVAALLAAAVVLEVLGFAVASGACLDIFADFATGMKTSW